MDWLRPGLSICLLIAVWALPLHAQELEPRSFNNIPVGQSFIAAAISRSDGELTPPGSSPLEEAELTIDVFAGAFTHTFSLAGDSAKVDIIAGRSCYEGWGILLGEYVEGRRCEYLDPKLKLTWNFYGAPALTPQEFRSWEQGLVVGAALAVSAPWGTYDSDHLINAGANRWSVKPSIGMSKRHGAWQWELKAGVNFYEDNDEFFNGIHLEQDPLYSTSVHLIRFFSRGWLSVDGNYFAGGRTNKNDVRQDDRQDNSRWGITWTRPVGQRHILKFSATTGVVTRIGNDFDSLAVGWLYRL